MSYIETIPLWKKLVHGEQHQGSVASIEKKCEMLQKSVIAKNPVNILEIGFNVGHSAIIIMDNVSENAKLTSIDIVKTKSSDILTAECSNFRFVHDNSLVFLTQYNGESFDFVFVDGDHRPETVSSEIDLLYSVVSSDCWVLFDDTHPLGGNSRGYGIGEMLNEKKKNGWLVEIGNWIDDETYENDIFSVKNFRWKPTCQRLFKIVK